MSKNDEIQEPKQKFRNFKEKTIIILKSNMQKCKINSFKCSQRR